ncbi:MAG TPA: prepilin peptidase [Solirubrobacterales bacterium]|nr:prepilin peptidase [Solirubrobacterales bacterium]
MGPAVVSAAVGGVCVGSFLTVVSHRVPRGEPLATGRSRCPSCGAAIAARDNVPVLSWLALRGRSRCCGRPISARYPLTEGLTALLFAAVVAAGWGDPGQIALGLVFAATLVAISVTDIERRIIPNRILLVSACAAVAILAIADPAELPEHLVAAVAAGGVLLVAALAYPRGMGMGDVKLAATMGVFLGREVAVAILGGLLAGSLAGVYLIARHGAGARKQAIPFGPFLALGGIVALFAGEAIADWYLASF